MPKQTFFNLAESKRQKILDLAIAEFAGADYANASISNIVKQAKIAKGSFYQYFEDKQDLYLHLIDLASQQRIAFIQSARRDQPATDFFSALHWLFITSTQFRVQYPQLNQLLNRATYGDTPLKQTVSQKVQGAAKQPIRDLVKQGLANGDLRAELDPDLLTYLIITAGDNLRYFIPEKLSLDTQKLAEGTNVEVNMQAVEQIFSQLIEVFESGMKQN